MVIVSPMLRRGVQVLPGENGDFSSYFVAKQKYIGAI
jgi:hypothetical protein